MKMEHVILVNNQDKPIGTMEKLEAHKKGLLHRAFSVLVFNSKGELMLQKRAKTKYHSGGLWTNTCCSHPRVDENLIDAGKRRLIEEMGIKAQPEFLYKFIYKAHLDKNLIEHELDHVFTATYDGQPTLNKDEAEDWKFVCMTQLKQDITQNPDQYTEWFKLIVKSYNQRIK